MLIYIVGYAIGIVLDTGALALSLFLVEDDRTNSFREFGTTATLARCAGLVTITNLLIPIPYGILLALVIWFVGIMFLFQKSFGQTVILFVLNVAVSLSVFGGLVYVLGRLFH